MSNLTHLLKRFAVAQFVSGKKHLLCIIVLVAFQHDVFAQVGEWTWMKGDAIPFGSSGTWGTQGVEDPANEPPSVYEACEWKDQQDNLWIFGGINNSVMIYYGTLWKYSMASNNWVWVSGPGTPGQPGVYGTQGVPSSSNYPGARGWGELSWTDSTGNFWLFGGYGYDASGNLGCLGDLWKYDVSTNEWTWVKGSSAVSYFGSYGIQGVPDISNNPPGRQEASCAWKDSHNNLWMFGGWTDSGNANDLWRYEISSNTWTWMKGANFPNQYGIYGTMGVSSPLNVPGGRAAYSRWIDKDDNLWFYGGNGNGSLGTNGFLSDLWKYTMNTNEWTWMQGSQLPFQQGVYGSKCEFSSFNHYPGDKYEGRSCWVDSCGYFFLYGGTGYNGHQGDLWAYNSITNEWAWLFGDTITNTSAVSGVQGVSSPFNKPGLRTGANSWIDQSGNLWLFGGYVCSNDLWRFVPDYSCIGNELCALLPQINFAVSDSELCEKFCISFFDSSTNNPISWQWLLPGGTPSFSTDQNPANICYTVPGTYDVTLITTNANGIDTLTLSNYITVYPTPPFPTITQVGYTLTSSPSTSYQWQLNSLDIAGATNQSYNVLQTGLYTVAVGDSNGCINSASQYVLITGVDEVVDDGNISIYPNPSSGSFTVEFSRAKAPEQRWFDIKVVNTLGQIVFAVNEKTYTPDSPAATPSEKKQIDLSDIAPGIYLIEIKTKSESMRGKILIAK